VESRPERTNDMNVGRGIFGGIPREQKEIVMWG
jgi:hypothetical protein